MSATAVLYRHLRDIHHFPGSGAHLKRAVSRLIQKDCHFHILGHAELIHNAVQMLWQHIVLLHLLLRDHAGNTFSVQVQPAL